MTDIIEVNNLTVSFRVRSGSNKLFERAKSIRAVDDVSFRVPESQTLGLAGETGSGKSTIAKVLVGIYRPTSGSVKLLGEEIRFNRKKDVARLRRNVGIVFQDPVGSLNPRVKVREIVREALIASHTFKPSEFGERIEAVLQMVGLRKSALENYPRELSGGEKQRVSLARALVVPKKLLILDEPTSSLDVSVQAGVLNLLRKLKDLELSLLFITHDINVIKYMSDYLGILYYGKMVEFGKTYDVVSAPKHPYSMKLMANVLGLKKIQVEDTVVEHGPAARGCIYSKVCPYAFERCVVAPPMMVVGADHSAACFLYEGKPSIPAVASN